MTIKINYNVAIIIALLCLIGCGRDETKLDLPCLIKKYSTIQLGYFKQSGFYDYIDVKRWKGDIKIGFVGDLTQEDSAFIDSLIMEMQPLFDKIRIIRATEDPNVTFYLTKTFKGKEITKMGFGFTRTYPKRLSPSEIEKAEIWISPALSALDRRKTMQHEFMHALGLEHPEGYDGTILGKKTYKSIEDYIKTGETYKNVSDLDSCLIKILYDPCIPDGLTKKEFDSQTVSLNL